MLNEKLLDEKDKRIAELRILIDKYKSYDAKRMVYVRDLEEKYKNLKESCDESETNKLKNRLYELQKGFDTLNKKLTLAKYPEYLDEYNNEELNGAYTFVNLKKQITEKNDKICKLRKTIAQLIYELNSIKTNETV